MALDAVAPVFVASAEEVEPLLRSRRAELASRALRLRNVEHETSRTTIDVEREIDDVRRDLRAALDARIAATREELSRALGEEEREARRAIDAARAEAAAIAAAAERRGLHVVPDPEPTTDAAVPIADSLEPDPFEIDLVALEDDPEPEPLPLPTMPTSPAGVGQPVAMLTADALREIVQAVVAAAVQPTAPIAARPIAPTPAPAVTPRTGPRGRRTVPVDVVLPLLGAVLVLIVLLAWAG